jgi:hypothetical protein
MQSNVEVVASGGQKGQEATGAWKILHTLTI